MVPVPWKTALSTTVTTPFTAGDTLSLPLVSHLGSFFFSCRRWQWASTRFKGAKTYESWTRLKWWMMNCWLGENWRSSVVITVTVHMADGQLGGARAMWDTVLPCASSKNVNRASRNGATGVETHSASKWICSYLQFNIPASSSKSLFMDNSHCPKGHSLLPHLLRLRWCASLDNVPNATWHFQHAVSGLKNHGRCSASMCL